MKHMKLLIVLLSSLVSFQALADVAAEDKCDTWSFVNASIVNNKFLTQFKCTNPIGEIAEKQVSVDFMTGASTCEINILDTEFVNSGSCEEPKLLRIGTQICTSVWSSVDTVPETCAGSNDPTCEESRSRWCVYHNGEMLNNVCFAWHDSCIVIH